jgi:uncharacterized protein
MIDRTDELEDLLIADPETGLKSLVALATERDLDAMYVLGMAHYDGDDGLELDRLRCIEMLEQAARQGHVKAAHDLGCFRFYGYGFPASFQDFRAATQLLEKSAAAGYPPSLTFLGSMYENGEGVTRDIEMARQLYQAAADRGAELGVKYMARLGASD